MMGKIEVAEAVDFHCRELGRRNPQWLAAVAGQLDPDSPVDRALVQGFLDDRYGTSEREKRLFAQGLPREVLDFFFSDPEAIPESATGAAILLRLNPDVLPEWCRRRVSAEANLDRWRESISVSFPVSVPNPVAGFSIADDQVAAMAAFLMDRPETPPLVLADVAEQWARLDPAAASRWVAGIPDAGARAEAAGNISEAWATNDVAAASEWVATLEPGWERDAAARALARVLVDYDKSAAMAWAESIGDGALRAAALESLRGNESP